MSSNPIQYVTLVSGGGTPVRLADMRGAPYPTTGQGSLVFSDAPTLIGPVTITGGITWTEEPTGPYHSPLTTRGDLWYYNINGDARLPIGASGTVLVSNGTDAMWGPSSSGAVNSITAGTGLTATPSNPITSSGSIELSDTTVIPGNYGSGSSIPTFTVDQQGRLTAASGVTVTFPGSLPPSGAAGGDLSGTYPNPTIKASVSLSGTPLSTTPVVGAAGTEIVTAAWVNAKNYSSTIGTVTSVAIVTANGFSGSVATPTAAASITLTTTIAGMIKGAGNALVAAVGGTDYMRPIDVSGAYQPLDTGLTALSNIPPGIIVNTTTDTFAARTLTGTTNRIAVTNGTGVSGNPVVDIDSNYAGQASIVTIGAVTTGTWNASIIAGQYGGTGIANTGKTITLGGNLATTGAFASTFAMTGTTSVTFPTTGTLATTTQLSGYLPLTGGTVTGNLTVSTTGIFTVSPTTTPQVATRSSVPLMSGTDNSSNIASTAWVRTLFATRGLGAAVYLYNTSTNTAVDPGVGKVAIETTVIVPPDPNSRRFAISKTDADSVNRYLMLFLPGDSLILTDELAPIDFYSRYDITSDPVDMGAWVQFNAAFINSQGLAPPLNARVKITGYLNTATGDGPILGVAAGFGLDGGGVAGNVQLDVNTTEIATVDSPTFTGDPKAPTPPVGDNDTSIATTKFVKDQGYLTTASAGTSYQPLDSDLTAIAALSTTGIIIRTGAGTVTTRSVTGATNRITVTNGDGVTANAVIDIAATYVGQSSITTLGVVTTGTWNAGVIAGQYGGTGIANTGKTITLGGNLTTSGAFASTFTMTGTTTVTFPTTGTLATTTQIPTTLPPSGAAGGALTGTYPNPTLSATASLDWTQLTSVPTYFPPDPEVIDDRVAALLVAGANVGLVYNDAANTLTISSSASGGSGGIPEAPNDGIQYGRQSLSWTPVSAGSGFLPLTGGTLTGQLTSTTSLTGVSTPALNITQTWNNAATIFYGINANFVDTASNVNSVLFNLAVGGSSRFFVNKAGSGVFVGNILGGVANAIGWTGRSYVWSPADGQVRLSNNAQTDFSRLIFGNATTAFPAIKKLAGPGLAIRDATDVADADITFKTQTYPNNTTLGATTAYVTAAIAGQATADTALYQPLDADLTALAGLSASVGLLEQTGAAAFTKRTMGATNATDVLTRADGDGRYMQPTDIALAYQPLDADLSALAGLTTTGIVTRTGTNLYSTRTITGTASRISVTQGDGVVGNPTINIDAAYAGQNTIVTVGTISAGTWQGTAVAGQYGGTGVNNSGKTITLGGNLLTSGAFASNFTMTNTTAVTFPTSGTLATTTNLASYLPLAGGTVTGNLTVNTIFTVASATGSSSVPLRPGTDNTSNIASTAWVRSLFATRGQGAAVYKYITPFNTTTDPGAGGMGIETITVVPADPNARRVALSKTDDDAVARYLMLFLPGDSLIITSEFTPITFYARYDITGMPVDNTTWVQMNAVFIGSQGVAPTSGTRVKITGYLNTATGDGPILGVAAGDGLLGGGVSGNVELDVNFAVVAALDSPTFTGNPTAPTPVTADNDTSISTTAFVKAQGYLTSAAAAAAYQPLDTDLTALAGLNATAGLVEQTGAAAFTKRLIGVVNATDVLTRADGDGRYITPATVAAAYQPLDSDLTAIAALATTGIVIRTGTGTMVTRSVTGATNRITVTNGDGVATNAVIDISAAYVGQSTITTLGTVATGTWNATVVAGLYGGTGVANSGKTITLGGNLTTAGAFASTFTMTGTTTVTFPTTGTLATLSDITGAYLPLAGGTLTGTLTGTNAIFSAASGTVLKTAVPDTSIANLFAGTTKGIRFGFSASTSTIEGVDSTGTASVQPLTLTGSSVTVTPLLTASAGISVTGSVAATGNFQTSAGHLVTTGGYVLVDRSTDATAAQVFIRSDAGQNSVVYFQSGGFSRWSMFKNGTAEGGSNAGSDFQIFSYDDAGVALATPLAIKRSTGYVTLGTSTAALARLHVYGTDQTAANFDPLGAQGSTVYVQGTGSAVGTGGAVMFGDSFGPHHAIKSYALSGTGPTGDLVIAGRKAGADVTFTEQARFKGDGTTVLAGALTGTAATFTGALTGLTATFTNWNKIYSATAPPTGGVLGAGYLLSSTANFGIIFGSGLPDKAMARGSLYLRSDATSDAPLYANVTGATSGWVPVGGPVPCTATAPTTPYDGQLWFNTDGSSGGGKLYIRYNDGNTTQWVPVA